MPVPVPWSGAALWVIERVRVSSRAGVKHKVHAVYVRRARAERAMARWWRRPVMTHTRILRMFGLDELPDGLQPGSTGNTARYQAARDARVLPARVYTLTHRTRGRASAVLGVYTNRAKANEARMFTDAYCGIDRAREYRVIPMQVHLDRRAARTR